MFKVMIHPATYETVSAAINKAFELFLLVSEDKQVLIKPKLLRGSEAKEGICTNPAVLRAVVEKVETMRPASIVVGDNPGIFSYGANRESIRMTGLMDAAKGHYQKMGVP